MRRKAVELFLVLVILISTGAARAQTPNFGDILGGFIALAQIQAARDAWDRLPASQRYCISVAMESRRQDITALIQRGVGPSDPRLSDYWAQCRRFTGQTLRENFSCTLDDDRGSRIVTRCDERYAIRSGAQQVVVAPEDAMRAHFAGRSVIQVSVEREDARERRSAEVAMREKSRRLSATRQLIQKHTMASDSRDVREAGERLLARVDRHLSSMSGPVDELLLQADEFVKYAEAEDGRLALLASLSRIVGELSARLDGAVADDLHRRYAQLASQISATPVPRAKTRAQAQRPNFDIGPSFDCARARNPSAQIVCSAQALRSLDVEFVRPYYTLRHALPRENSRLRDEAVEFSRTLLRSCRIPERGDLSAAAIQRLAPCLRSAYQRQKRDWESAVSRLGEPAAMEEISRPIDEHYFLQFRLQEVGQLASDAGIDGVYGPLTRQAIETYQRNQRLTPSGFMSEETARSLAPAPGEAYPIAELKEATRRLAEIEREYLALSREVAAVESAQAEERELRLRIDQARATAMNFSSKPLPLELRAVVEMILQKVPDGPLTDIEALRNIDRELDQLRPQLAAVAGLADIITSKNRVLFEGDADDILLFFNASPDARGVLRTLSGSLVFDPARARICMAHGPLADRHALQALRDLAMKLSIPLPDQIAACVTARLPSYDLVILRRGSFLAEPAASAAAMASAVDADVFSQFGGIEAAYIREAAQRDAIRALEAEAAVLRGLDPGYGIVALDNGSSSLCAVTGEDRDIHETLLLSRRARISEELGGRYTLLHSSPDAAFLSARRRSCGGLYASAGDLKILVEALRRDSLTHRFLPIWVEASEIETERLRVAEAREQTRRKQEEAAARKRAAALDAARRESLQRVEGLRSRAVALLRLPLRADVRNFLAAFVDEAKQLGPDSSIGQLETLELEFKRRQSRIDEAEKLARTLTERNLFIVEGSSEDILLLLNESPAAPSVVRNLRGELVFEGRMARICTPHGALTDVFINRQVRHAIQRHGAEASFPAPECGSDPVTQADLIVIKRGSLLLQSVSRVATILDLVERGTFRRLGALTADDINRLRDEEASAAAEVMARVKAQLGDGFGVANVINASSVVCQIAESNKEAHQAIAARHAARIADELSGAPSFVSSSVDSAFISARRGHCGAIYALDRDLNSITAALERDGLPFRFLPLWIATQEVVAEAARSAEAKRIAAERETELRLEREGRAQLEALRANDRELERTTQERRLRTKYSAMAKAFELKLAEEIKRFINNDRSDFRTKHPKVYAIYARNIQDRWELVSLETEILDYGTAQFRGRTLETGFAVSRVQMRNKLLGEYKSLCFITGYINDAEFDMQREPLGESCEDGAGSLQRLMQGQAFVSRWNVR